MGTRKARGHAASGGGRRVSALGVLAATVVLSAMLAALPTALRAGVDDRSDSQVTPAAAGVDLELRLPDLPPPAYLPAGDPVIRHPRPRVVAPASSRPRPVAHFVAAGRTPFWATTLPPPALV